MSNTILIVDDDQDLLLILKESLESSNDNYKVLISGSVNNALSKLQSGSVSLLITDLRMPGIDGFALLTYVSQNYPDLPVIVMTAYPYKDVDRMSFEKGAIGFIKKPFRIEELDALIKKILKKQSEGGIIHGISIPLFLQMIEMEQKTCTVRILNRTNKKKGVLFFKNGELLDARLNSLTGLEAAQQIVSWDDVSIFIENSCKLNKKNIDVSLNALILEAMRVKDENSRPEEAKSSELSKLGVATPEEVSVLTSYKSKLKSAFAGKWLPKALYVDNSLASMIKRIKDASIHLNLGEPKVIYLEKKAEDPIAIIPDKDIVVMKLDSACPRDKLLRILSE